MLSNLTVKSKLILLVVLSLLITTLILSTLTIKKTHKALVDSQFKQLSSIQNTKKGEILNYFESLKGLLVSIASNEGTKDALLAFEYGFYNLKDELNLDINTIKSELTNDFKTNYLEKVNYDIPNAQSKKDINSYLPKDENALIAQYIFITDNENKLGEKNNLTYIDKYASSYLNAHKKYHESFNTILNNYSLYDIFIADMKGNLIYTDFKEKDFATNLKTGVYSNTGIGKVYKKALELKHGEIAFDDFEPYEPSYNSPASFIATPIIQNGTKLGVLIFQMPVDKINNIMQFGGKFKEAGLGNSGEAYLVGSDYKMRSNSRFVNDIKNELVQNLKSTISIWEVKTLSTTNAIEKDLSGQNLISDYRGVNVFSSYAPIEIFNTKWSLIVEIDEDEALSDSKDLEFAMIITSIVVLLIMAVISVLLIKSAVINPIENFTNYLEDFISYITYKKTKIEKVKIKSEKNEFSDMVNKLNSAVDDFDTRLKNDMKVMGETALILDRVSCGSYSCRIKSKTNNPMIMTIRNTINKMLETVAMNMDELGQTLGQYTNDNYTSKVEVSPKLQGRMKKIMEAVNTLGDTLATNAKQSLESGETLQKNSTTMKSSMENLSTKANEQAASLEQTAAAIEEITSTLRNNGESYSRMSNLGNDVKTSVDKGLTLANLTTSSMDEINKKVTAINDAIDVIDQIAFQTNILSLNAAVEAATAGEAGKGFAVVAAEVRNLASRSAQAAKEIKELVEDATNKANDGKSISDDMIKGYGQLNEKINETIHLIDEVSLSSKEQVAAVEQINDTVNMLDKVTQENANEANHISAISNDVSLLADKLVENAKTKKF